MTKRNKNVVVPQLNNFVAKYANEFCKAQTHKCKKKDMKRGYQKHKDRHDGLYAIRSNSIPVSTI